MNRTVTASFYKCLQHSRLLAPEQIAEAVAVAGAEEPHLSRYLVDKGLLTRFQARQLRQGSTGFHVDKYIVVDYIGRGGHSVVYKARHSLLPNRYVALKTLTTNDLHADGDVLERFRREVEIVSGLDHPNVVRAYDVIQRRAELFLVLEFVDGCDLARLVSQFGPLPIPDAANYGLQAARALAYAHRCGIVHRDVKPANLLLGRDGVVKLADLGLAQFLAHESSTDPGRAINCLGTPEFMAPEQAEKAEQVDARSDLYSLGATLFHLLTGQLPVSGGSYLHRLQKLLTSRPRPLAEARTDVPTEIAVLVDRLRARDPHDRPASADEVIALLQPYAASTTAASNPQDWDGRRKAALILEVLEHKTSLTEAAAAYGIAVEELERWRHRFLEGAARSLDPGTPEAIPDAATINALYAKIGAQAMEIELLKKRV